MQNGDDKYIYIFLPQSKSEQLMEHFAGAAAW